MLKSVEQIIVQLDQEFTPLENTITGFRLLPHVLDASAIQNIETNLKCKLPEIFCQLIQMYNFGHFTLGPIVFGYKKDYVQHLLSMNMQINWWGVGVRPENFIMIANSDPYAIILEVNEGKIYSLQAGSDINHMSIIAKSFELFLCGVASILFGELKSLEVETELNAIVSEVGGVNVSFWRELAH